MASIEAIAPEKASGEAPEYIEALWNAFMDNYKAFKTGKMKLKDEVKYNLFSAPGPRQYQAFSMFFSFFKGEEKQIWNIWKENNNYMYTYDFSELNEQNLPAILVLLQKLYSNNYTPNNNIPVMMVSGSFWKRHIDTRKNIINLLKNMHENDVKLRILTCAKKEEEHIETLFPVLGQDSCFNIMRRIPIHFLLAYPYLYFEFPHTESSTFRLNMLIDLDNMKYKRGKSKEKLLEYLNKIINEALQNDIHSL